MSVSEVHNQKMGLALLQFLIAGSVAWAHPMDAGRLDFQIEGDRIEVRLELHDLAFQKLTSSTDAQVLFEKSLGPDPVYFRDQPCQWLRPSLKPSNLREGYQELSVVAVCTASAMPEDNLRLKLNFLGQLTPAFRLVSTVLGVPAWEHSVAVIDAKKPIVSFGPESVHGFSDFFWMGMAHIGVSVGEWRSADGWHLPEGIDHIAFVIALVLLGTGLRSLVASATGFTVGHSVTLGLATFGVIHVHSIWVEILIAFSIAFLAGQTVFRAKNRHGFLVCSVFGCVHGLGFSAALHDLQLAGGDLLRSLIGFNFGVECAQIVIVILTWSLLRLTHHCSPRVEVKVHFGAALLLLVVGSFWTINRLLGQ